MNQKLSLTEIFEELRTITYGAWRYRWKGIAVIWVICLSGWFWVMTLPDIYEASSRVFIDTSSTLEKLLVDEVVELDTMSEARIMVQSLTSRPSLGSIATRTGMLVGGESASQIESVIRGIQGKLTILLDRSQILNVAYQDENAEMALAVATQVVDSFVEGLLVVNRGDSDVAQDFLQEQIQHYEELLSQAEMRLAEFKKENIGQMPGAGGDYFSRLQNAERALTSIDFEIKLAQERQAELTRQLEGEAPVFGISSPNEEVGMPETAVGRQVQQYEEQLVLLRMQYTDSHPDIVRINSILEDLRAQQAEERSNLPGGSSGGAFEENRVYQSMRMQLSNVEIDLIELQAKRANQMRVVFGLREKIDIIPEVEASLTRLNRDYEVNKAQYDGLLRRLETAKMTERAESSKTQFDFRIMDPPTVSPSPVGPNRLLFMSAVLIVAIGAGVMLTIFLSFTRPVFFSVRALEQRFDLPVLGGIRYVASNADIVAEKRNLTALVAAFAAVFCLFILVISFDQVGADFISGLLRTLGPST